ncbi:MAG TPA: alpha-galactosidase, partial [Phycisphaerae bacterium]|nr:alpha-galactosidase [Phycisphaerae bacterium]
MYSFNSEKKVFSIRLKSSEYLMRIDDVGRLVHCYWKPVEAHLKDIDYPQWEIPFGSSRPDELLCFGDTCMDQIALKAEFADVNGNCLRDIRLRYQSHDIVANKRNPYEAQHGLSTKRDIGDALVITMFDELAALTVRLVYRACPTEDIIERWVEVENAGKVDIRFDQVFSASLHLPTYYKEIHSVDGAWGREFNHKKTLLETGKFRLEKRGFKTGHNQNPFFLVNRPAEASEEHGTVYFGQLSYSSHWAFEFELLSSGLVNVFAGENDCDFELILPPGEKHVTPILLAGVTASGWGDASRQMHRFIRDYRLVHEGRFCEARPVLFNSWLETRTGIDSKRQLLFADKAAELGIELFCVDAQWYAVCDDSFQTGLGDWTVCS